MTEPMKKVTGGMLPAQIWHNFMQPALAKEPMEAILTRGDVPDPMPWQRDITEGGERPAADVEQAPEAEESISAPAPVEQRDLDAPAAKKRDVELSPSFWNKLGKSPGGE